MSTSESKVVLVTGAGSGIGRLTVRTLMAKGHHVFAEYAQKMGLNGAAVELDILDQRSIAGAVQTVLDKAGRIDVLIHNAAHLYVGITEAFSPDQLLHSMDTNAVGAMRVNRAVLPHMRKANAGLIVWVGSGVARIVPPFLGPYAAAKAAMDAFAEATASEVGAYGIETTIVMPGPFIRGTEHFPKLEAPADAEVAAAYDRLTEAIAVKEKATAALFPPGADPDPVTVADEIVRIVDLPRGTRPFRVSVDFSDYGDQAITAVAEAQKRRLFRRMGLERLLPPSA